MTRTRLTERAEFLSSVLCTAIEHYGYGFPEVVEYDPGLDDPMTTYALIVDRYEPGPQIRVELETIAAGIGVIQRAVLRVDPKYPNDGPVLHNAKTSQRLYLHPNDRKLILEQSRENDGGEIDVVLALAILECATYGAVTYT